MRADTEVKALRIFSVLNDRGIDLHPVDILKASILEKTSFNTYQKEKYANQWEEFEQQFERTRFQDLVTHIRMTYVRARTQIPLHEDILKRIGSAHSAEEFLKIELPEYAAAFEELQYSEDLSIQNLREIGKRSRFKDWEAPALFLLKNKAASTNWRQALKELTGIVALLVITKAPDGQRAGRFGRIIDDFESLIEERKAINNLESLKVARNEWLSFENNLKGDAYSIRGLKAGLLWLETISGDGERSVSTGEITIEHLLPRNPGNELSWIAHFPTEVWREHSNRVGNLVLVSGRANSKLGRKSFLEKKQYITGKGGTSWVWTQAALDNENWTPTEILNREMDMVEKARSFFKMA